MGKKYRKYRKKPAFSFLNCALIVGIAYIIWTTFGSTILSNIHNIAETSSNHKVLTNPVSTAILSCPKPEISSLGLKVGITHFKYSEATASDLRIVDSNYPAVSQLHKDAFVAFKKMKVGALKDNVTLEIISGFRSVEAQKWIIANKKRKGKTDDQIYLVTAPDGHSEHHTGLALDVGGTVKDPLIPSFSDTNAGKWLSAHAHEYGFEFSFPESNFQKVSYEPWHLRFIGTEHAKKIFCFARSQSNLQK